MKGVSIDEFCSFKYVSGASFSPKGSNLCCIVSEADRDNNNYRSYIYKRDGENFTRLTAGGKEGSFTWLDEDTILFPGDRDEKKNPSTESKFYKISLHGGEAEKAYTFPVPVHGITVLPDGNFLLLGSTFPGFEELYTGDKKLMKEYQEHRKAEEDFEVVTENPWWWNGGTYTRGVYDSLFFYDVKKKTMKRLTETGFTVYGFQLAPDKKTVYFNGVKKSPCMFLEDRCLYKLDLQTGNRKMIFEGGKNFLLYDYYAGENFAVLLLSDMRRMGRNSNPDFYRLDYETDAYELIAGFDEATGSSVGCDIRRGGGHTLKMAGDTVYFVATLFDGAYLMKLENGQVSRITEEEGSVDNFDVCGDEIVVNAFWDMKGSELYTADGKQLTHFNDKVLRGKYLAVPEKCNVVNGDHEIHGFVLKPMNFDPAEKYPVILDIHGGPKTVYGEVYYHEMQYWAGKGYFVIFCNPTGSDGRGSSFANICGKYGTVDYEDIMAFTDKALADYPQMDASHVYETGGSYGGFMTNWIIGHTDRFCAVATQRSISNWTSFYGVSDIGVSFVYDQNLTDPWLGPEKLWERSPMKYYDKVTTPTLVLHSMEDYRCPIDQGYQLYASLCERGIDSKMVLFKGENHDLSRSGKPKSRIRRLKEITEWFEKHQ